MIDIEKNILSTYIKTIILIISLCIYSLSFKGQDVPYSQQFSNLVSVNPAFAGTTLGNRYNVFYRNQWLITSSGFYEFGLAFDSYFSDYNSGVGLLLKNEVQGAYVSPSLDFSYSYIVRLNANYVLSMGLQAGINQKYFNISDLDFRDEEVIGSGLSRTYADFSSGIVGLSKNGYVGFSVDHLARPFVSSTKSYQSKLDRKYTVFAGYIYEFNTRLIKQERYLSPNILWQLQGVQHNITWGSSFQYQSMTVGLWMRNNFKPIVESVIISAGFKTKSMRITYSYDINVGKKTTQFIGANEISFTRRFNYEKNKKFKALKALSFLL